MKSIAFAVLVTLAAFGVAAVADAQGGSSPSGTQAPATQAPSSGSSGASGSVSTPSGEARGQVNVDPKPETPTRSDDGSALPRSAVTERTTIFGLSLLWIAAILTLYTGYDYLLATIRHIKADET